MSDRIFVKIYNEEKSGKVNASLEEFIELNKEFNITTTGKEIFYSFPFNVTIEKKFSEDLSIFFPLLTSNFYKKFEEVSIGELEKDPVLLSIVKLCYNLPKEVIKQIDLRLRNASVDKSMYRFSPLEKFAKSEADSRRGEIFCYLVKSGLTLLALEHRNLFENKSFSINFLLDFYTKLEELDDLLSD